MGIKFKTPAPVEDAASKGVLSVVNEDGTSTPIGVVTGLKIEPAKSSMPKPGSFLAQKLAEKTEDEPQQELPVTQAQTEPEVEVTDEVSAQVNELINLDAKLKEMGAYESIKRIEEIKKTLQSIAADHDPSTPAVFNSSDGMVVFSECRHETKITDNDKLIALMTPEVYLKAASMTLTTAKKYLSDLELKQVTTSGWGSRTLKAVVKKAG